MEPYRDTTKQVVWHVQVKCLFVGFGSLASEVLFTNLAVLNAETSVLLALPPEMELGRDRTVVVSP